MWFCQKSMKFDVKLSNTIVYVSYSYFHLWVDITRVQLSLIATKDRFVILYQIFGWKLIQLTYERAKRIIGWLYFLIFWPLDWTSFVKNRRENEGKWKCCLTLNVSNFRILSDKNISVHRVIYAIVKRLNRDLKLARNWFLKTFIFFQISANFFTILSIDFSFHS